MGATNLFAGRITECYVFFQALKWGEKTKKKYLQLFAFTLEGLSTEELVKWAFCLRRQ